MKTIAGLFFFIVFAFASNHTYTIKAKILEKIFANISIGRELVIYLDDEKLTQEFEKRGNFATTAICENATLLVLQNKKNLEKSCYEKAIFVLGYDLLKEIPQSFGAIFWKKGRPNIVILAPRTKEQSITISDTLKDYVEEKIW